MTDDATTLAVSGPGASRRWDERTLRTHWRATAAAALAVMASIAVAQVCTQIDVSLALSYAVPLWVFTYATGAFPGTLVAVAVAGLWLFDVANLDLSTRDLEYAFATRLLTNLALVVMAAVSARAAEARDGHLAAQERLLQMRRDLVAAFSHDLRAPLSAIVGYLQMLRDEGAKAPAHTAETIERALANAQHIDGMMRDMLGAEQSDSPFSLRLGVLQPFQLLNDLRIEFGDLDGPSAGVHLLWEVDPDTPPLGTDRHKLTSVVRNLVSNALKFTSVGTVRIRIGYEPETALHRIEVTDTGRGITPEALPHIFTRFYQAADSTAVGGIGFGLFIVRTFVHLLGGTVEVSSEPGCGASFVVRVPSLVAESLTMPVAAAG